MAVRNVKIDSAGLTVIPSTKGSILYVGNSGILAEDNANLKWDDIAKALNVNALNASTFLAADGAINAPSIGFINETNTGFYRPGAGALYCTIQGALSLVIRADGPLVPDNVAYAFGNARDLILTRDAANTLAQRNDINAQSFNIYNTYTDAANFERAQLKWNGGIFTIQTAAGGVGLNRGIKLGSLGVGQISFATNSIDRWAIDGNTGSLLTFTDNSLDIGAAGANRPRAIYVGTSIQLEADAGLKLTNQVSTAAAQAGTLTNSPVAGNPAFWLKVSINGTQRSIPCW